MRTVDQYVLQVLADPWANSSPSPSVLDVSRRGVGLVEELARVGFRVTRVTLEESSLETVGERLAGMSRQFDAVVVRDVLEVVDDWREVVVRAARRLVPGGVFVYGVSARAAGGLVRRLASRWGRSVLRPAVPAAEMFATLRRIGMFPRETILLGPKIFASNSAAHMGHYVMRAAPVPAAVRRELTRTGERFVSGARA